jgi:hypothetical protein
MDVLAHGGSLFIVPDEWAGRNLGAFDQVFTAKYEMNGPRGWDLLVRFNKRLRMDPHQQEEDYRIRRLDNHEAALRSVVHFGKSIGRLTAVDGAVVVSTRWQIIGFGCEIIADPTNFTRVTQINADGNRDCPIDTFGTRHRSMFRACRAVPDSLGFIVSQDGGIKAVANYSGSVNFWPLVQPWAF